MFKKSRIVFSILALSLFAGCSNKTSEQPPIKPGWPDLTNTSKPWSRWWWMGGCVDKKSLNAELKKYQEAGLGGLEITTIYGVQGMEDKFISYTSPEWMEMLTHTLSEADNLGLGIDMALASGWPFGGPWVQPGNSCKYLEVKTFNLPAGEAFTEKIDFFQKPLVRTVGKRANIELISDPIVSNDSLQVYAFDQVRFPGKLPLQALIAFSNDGEVIDLTSNVNDEGVLEWEKQRKDYTLIAAFSAWHGKMVERAGPGGEGDVIDHFSDKATASYLSHFDTCFKGYDISKLRAFFNDSYEVDDAFGESNWTPAFFDEFQKRRGYSLKEKLPALIGLSTEEEQKRVICDYRETLSDLLLDNYTVPWQKWAAQKGKIIRNQPHGSPANILDLYAASDIPETEGTDELNIKFASSAAHVTGKKLVSAEAATWLNEHFLANLAATRENVDRYLTNGVNHIVFHGTTFSPEEEGWPGRMFYAAVHYAPTNPLWKDLPALNAYIAKSQSFLQRSRPDNDILVYFPIYDQWMDNEHPGLYHFHGADHKSEAYQTARKLQDSGYTFDFISDRQIANLRFKDNLLVTQGNNTYKTILIPKTEFIPLKTFQKLIALASNGAKIIFLNQLPGNVPGLGNFSKKMDALTSAKNALKPFTNENGIQTYKTGKGYVFVGSKNKELLSLASVEQEMLVEYGLNFYRFKDGQTSGYFLTNWTGKTIEKWISFNSKASEILRYDPMTGLYGKIKTRTSVKDDLQVLIKLDHGESCILQFWSSNPQVNDYPYWKEIKDQISLNDGWNLDFVSGGPMLPQKIVQSGIGIWNGYNDTTAAFSGQAVYSRKFSVPGIKCDAWKLSLGKVFETAHVNLNGKYLGTLIGPEYSLIFDNKLITKEMNTIEITVSNLMANRISYMDKNNEPYRIFYNVNFAPRLKENTGPDRKFTAINWEPVKSGIEGPVNLTPLLSGN